jgi:hypothetical protein
MRFSIVLLASAMMFAAAGAANAASVEVRDAVVRVIVIPEERSDVKVDFLATNPKLPIQVRHSGGTTIIDGDLRHRIARCHGHRGERPRVRVRGVGEVGEAAMPQVVIHTPRAVVLSSNGAVFGSIGRAGSIELQDSGCSAWTVADVAGDAAIRESGEGSLRMGAAGRLDVHLSGAASIHVVRVRQALSAQLSGAGDVKVGHLDGSLDAQVSGVGRVRVEEGHASMLHASVSGVGGVDFGGTADSLDAAISGFGSIRVRQVTGPVTKSISGAGHVTVNERPA